MRQGSKCEYEFEKMFQQLSQSRNAKLQCGGSWYLHVVASVILLSCSHNVFGQTRFWLTSDNATGGASQVAPVLEVALGDTADILLWTQPTNNLQNFSLNVVSTSDSVLRFDSVEIDNVSGGSDRFEFVFDTTNGLPLEGGFCDNGVLDRDPQPTQAIWDLRGFTLNSRNASGLSAGASGTHLATITVSGLSLGSTDLYLQVGEIGINEVGDTTLETDVSFGSPDDDLLNAGLNRCVNSETSDAMISVVETPSLAERIFGDFNDDGLVDASDIDLLSIEDRASTHKVEFDVTGDNLVNELDRSFWVTIIKETVFGDVDLDRSVGFSDFLLLRDNFGKPGGWASGDFDGDANVTFADFLLLGDTFGTPVAVTPVPEPGANHLALFGLLSFLLLRIRRLHFDISSPF